MANRILLTGAGFTHNFGAPLASEVSNLIFNSITDNSQLLDLLRNNFDYEAVYQTVMQSKDYDKETKNTFTSAVTRAYDIINKLIKNQGLSNINSNNLKQLLKGFDKPDGSGFIFTLNQDLFLDENIKMFSEILHEIPVQGREEKSNDYPFERLKLYISYNDFDKFKKEKQNFFNKNNPRIYYIKLHGSQDWFKDDNNQIMVIGHGKSERIQVEPILEWYFDIFKQQLNKANTKLLIIGYSFRDEHINQVIYDNKDNLKIYIVNPQSFENFSNALTTRPFGNEIRKLITKYYAVTLAQLFGDNTHEPHPYWNQLQFEFFENQWYKNRK